ncbi:hypothetical protein [Actinoplanes regularis]|nr:hypothetical protein [Actinoplanes regularis]
MLALIEVIGTQPLPDDVDRDRGTPSSSRLRHAWWLTAINGEVFPEVDC